MIGWISETYMYRAFTAPLFETQLAVCGPWVA
jgi:hypothetical protein